MSKLLILGVFRGRDLLFLGTAASEEEAKASADAAVQEGRAAEAYVMASGYSTSEASVERHDEIDRGVPAREGEVEPTGLNAEEEGAKAKPAEEQPTPSSPPTAKSKDA